MTAVPKQYRIGYPKKVTAGWGSIEELSGLLLKTGARHVCVVTDRGVLDHGSASRAVDIVKKRNALELLVCDIPAEPSVDDIISLYDKGKEHRIDLIAAVGGGSVMDAAKVLAAMLPNPEYAEDIRDTDRIEKPSVPTVMIPTTAGTGAEVTPNAIFYFPEEQIKEGVVCEQFLPDSVILDPSLTETLPPPLTASCGLDALCHAVEAYLSTLNNPFCTLHSFKAVELITGYIEAAYEDGGNKKAREMMQLGAFYAGMCLSTSSTIAVHALSYPLGGRWRIPHGVSNAILLPSVMEAHLDCCGRKFAAIARYVPGGEAVREEERPEWFVQYLAGLTKRLKIPDSLSEFGIGETDLAFLTEGALGVTRLLSRDPKVFTSAEIKEIYRKLIKTS